MRPRFLTRLVTRLAAVLLALAASGGLVVAAAVPASAHAVLLQTSPEEGEQVAAAPSRVVLTFDESVGISERAIEVLDAAGARVDDGVVAHPAGQGSQVTVGLRPALPRGSYAVVWHVVSADSHPVAGTFSFGVGVPAGAVLAVPSGDRAVGVLDGVARFLSFVGVVLLVGGGWFLVVLWPAGTARKRPRRVLLAGWVAGAVAAVMLFFLQGPYGAGLGLGDLLDCALVHGTFTSRYGKLMGVRLLVLLLAIPALRQLFSRSTAADGEEKGPGTGHRIDLAGLGVVFLLTFSLSEHAGTGSQVPLAVAADVLHLVAVSIWLGGLVMLGTTVLWRRRPGELAALLPRWSRTAAVAVVALVVSGVYGTWRNVGSWAGLGETSYGRLLLAKWGGLLAVLVLANAGRVAVGRWNRTPEVEPAAAQVKRLRMTVGAETVLATGILVLTTWLVNDVPARTSYAPPFEAQAKGQDAEGRTIQVTLDADPTRTGPTTIHLYAYDAVGKVLPYTSASGDLEQTGPGGLGPVRFAFADSGPGHGTAENVVVPAQGDWDLTVEVVTPDGDDYAATATYRVRP